MNDEMKERYERSMRPLSLKMTYLLEGNRKIPANWVLYDEHRCEVIKPVSKKFNLINNSELIGKLSEIGKYKILSVNANKSNDTFYYSGYFPEMAIFDTLGDILYIGFEVGNSFSGRFLPYANYSLYHYKYSLFIKTNLPIFEYKRSNFHDSGSKIESLSFLMNFFKDGKGNMNHKPDISFIKDIIPEKLYFFEDFYEGYAGKYGTNLYTSLLFVSSIIKDWSNSAYELALFSNYKLWDMLIGTDYKKTPPHLTEEELTITNQEELFNNDLHKQS